MTITAGQGTSSTTSQAQPRRGVLARLRGLLSATPGYAIGAGWPPPNTPPLEQALVDAVNAHRATLGLPKLAVHPGLVALEEWKSSDQAWFLYMDHNQPAVNGQQVASTVGARFAAFGFNGGWGENIAYGQTDVASVMAAWLSDDGHKGNIENPSWTHIGCGTATALKDGSNNYLHQSFAQDLTWWGQAFAAITTPPPPPPAPPAKGSHWRLKLNPLAKPITVTGEDAQGRVLAQNRKGQPLKPMTIATFLKKYTPV